jgi:runt-related transcription factor 1
MPDSPNEGTSHPAPRHSASPVTSSVAVAADTRSVSSTSPHVNGSHASPLGNTSPPTVGNGTNQLPPACGARQLSKLKRFLTTLQQFGSDISPEIGERVRGLVLNLVVSIYNTMFATQTINFSFLISIVVFSLEFNCIN